MNQWKYFNLEKGSDKKLIGVKPFMLNLSDTARHNSGIPYIPVSGFRTVEENRLVGGVPDSAHITGDAVDWLNYTSHTAFRIVKGLITVGIDRIGLNLTRRNGQLEIAGIHSDIDTTKDQEVLWVREY